MGELLARFDGNLHASLVAYNMGPARVAAMLTEHAALPAENTWYSRYIYDHLTSVLHDEKRQPEVAAIASDVIDCSFQRIQKRSRARRNSCFIYPSFTRQSN